jgi:glycosyltransferase involved in cell wall biosynthesis
MIKNKRAIIITPLLNEEDNIVIFYERYTKIISKIKGYTFSFLFVDDGSTDKTWGILSKLSKKNKNVSAIKLSRNFGSYVALPAGLEIAYHKNKFDYFIMTTVDLQNPPELLPQLISKLKLGARVVYGTREERVEGVTGMFSNLFWYLIRRYALANAPSGGTDYCVIDKKVASDVVASNEKNSHIFNLIVWLGYHQETIPFERKKIEGRKSRWTLQKKIKLLIDTFASFSYAPIRLVTYMGLATAFVGFTYAMIVVIRRIIFNINIEGWSSLMFVVLVLFGFNMIMLGVIAEYLWRTFDASRKRPMYLLDKKVNI